MDPCSGLTGKSLSEALIFASTNPQYDDRCSLNYKFNTWKFLAQNMGRICCVQKLFWVSKKISVHNMFSPCSELGIFMYWTCNSMTNLSSYCGLVDAKIRASDKNLPVSKFLWSVTLPYGNVSHGLSIQEWFCFISCRTCKNRLFFACMNSSLKWFGKRRKDI